MSTDLPYLAHGPIGQAFAEQSQDFGYLYDRGQSVAWVKSRWSVGDKGDLLLKAAIGRLLHGAVPEVSEGHSPVVIVAGQPLPTRRFGGGKAPRAQVEILRTV